MKIDRIRLQRFGRPPVDLYLSPKGFNSPFVITNVNGLSPPDSELFYSDFQNIADTGKGVIGIYTFNPRALDFTIKLNPVPGQSHSELRDEFYANVLFGADNNRLRVSLYNDTELIAYSYGFTTKADGALFTKEPTISYSMDCPNPYFLGSEVIFQQGELDILNATPQGYVTFSNPGTAISGIEAEIKVLASDPEFYPAKILMNLNGLEIRTMDIPDPTGTIYKMNSSDVIYEFSADGVDRAYKLAGKWPRVLPKDNVLSFFGSVRVEVLSVKFTPRYIGV